jgi:Tol biopolymer transport system component
MNSKKIHAGRRILLITMVAAFTLLTSSCADTKYITEFLITNLPGGELTPIPTAVVQPIAQPEVEDPTPTPGIAASALPILFTSSRGAEGTTDIFRINPDGSGLIRLTDDPATDRDPVWAPNQKAIAFTSDRTGKAQIYLLFSDDYSIRQLSNHPAGAESPTWAPDGKTIAFVEPGGENQSLLLVDVLSGEIGKEIDVGLSNVANPAWSALGDMIAFTATDSRVKEDRDIFAITLDQEKIINLTNHWANEDHAAWSQDGARIAFQTDRDGDNNIYMMNSNGALQTPLTEDRADDIEPDWSGDGRKIVFSSDREGQYHLHIISESGTDLELLAPVKRDDRQASWSDPPKLLSDVVLYTGSRLKSDPNLFTIDVTDFEKSQLANLRGIDWTPEWSPDGKRIAFSSNDSGEFEIYVINADGSGEVKQLTVDSPGKTMHPSWSPNGDQIAYESKSRESWDIWVMNADGSNARNLTADSDANYGNPAWSPDGKQIALSSDQAGKFEIFVMNANGSGEIKQLTDLGEDAFHPAWSPDGQSIAFRVNHDGRRQIYVMTSSGSSVKPMFTSQWNDDMPTWSPDGNRIVFVSDRGSKPSQSSEGFFSIYIYNLSNGEISPVTTDMTEDARYPVWKPRPTPVSLGDYSEPDK